LKIAINTRLLLKDRLEGIGWFTYENLKRITIAHPEHEFYFFFDRPYSQEFVFSDNVKPIVLFPQARHPVLYYTWFEYSVRKALKKINADLFISTDGYVSLSAQIKTFNVFHDLNFEHYPKDIPFLERWYYRKFFVKFAHKASRIATVSEFSKQDIVKLYNISPDKIDVVYNGANEIYCPKSNDVVENTRVRYSEGLPYFYFIGSLHRRKNLINLFLAFDIFRSKSVKSVKLIITGAKKWWTEDMESVYSAMKFKDDVIFTGRLSLNEISDLMGSALALTYVSYFEGFGIPIIEAFRSEIPVITSNVTSMPEIAGDAALLTDPFNPDDIALAMQKVSEDNRLRESLIAAGRIRAKEFTWEKSAERLWVSIEKLLGE
jgi:glycosyltransferase involved in cell wall biosynthesis